ncbi:Nitrogen assimilation transcription factor nirA [Fusarium oxysporum f. sp. raphani]|nr:Nitrogen assimilation transcription factor nirA [Fusarium oxysporum f. sp. raphani]
MNDHGVDGASYQYLTKAVALAKRMGLFNSPSDDMEHDVDPSTKVVREVTAWALFAWQGVMSSMLYEPPLITEPPQTSYPDPLEMPFWYSDLRVRYPSSQEVISTRNHQTFKAYLEFWAIFNDIASVSFPPGRDRSYSLSQAVDFYARLRSWFEGLPNDLQPGKIVLPCQLKLHIQYWLLLMDLFKPFADWDQRMEGLDKTSSEIYRDARWNQAYVLRIYYLRHGTEAYDCWFSMFLFKLGFVALQEVASSSDRDASLSNLILALTSLDNQGKCCFMSEFTLRTICAQMRSEDLAIFKQFATFEDLDDPQAIASRMSRIRSKWPVNMDFAKRERKSLRDVAAEAIGMDMTDDE